LLVALAAMNSQVNLLFWLFGVMAAGLVVSGVVSGIMMLGLRCRRLDLRHGEVGEPLVVRYEITNRNRLVPVFNVQVEECTDRAATWPTFMAPTRAWIMHIGPRETIHAEAVFWPRRRGAVHFDRVRIWTTFPFGIIKKSVTFTRPQHTLVHPQRYALRPQVVRALAPEGLMGAKVTQRSGLGDDYFGMREYRPGDSLHHVAWKRSACQDTLLCIERSRSSPPRLTVILNLTRPTADLRVEGGVDAARLLEERAISLAASIIHQADLGGYEVGLSIQGSGVPDARPRRSHWHRQKLMAALGAIDLDAARPPAASRPDEQRTAEVVVHPDRVDPALGGPHAWHLTARQLAELRAGGPPRSREAAA
jgi:uncharacterized protein (DUF58 family)